MKELIYASATALARAIRDREVSSTEVVEAHLQRIETVNPKLNAIVGGSVWNSVAAGAPCKTTAKRTRLSTASPVNLPVAFGN